MEEDIVVGSTSNSGGQQQQRVGKACDTCRRRKERCDGRRPRCSACVGGARRCQYDAPDRKRGLKQGMVHSLEKVLALALALAPGTEDSLITLLSDGLRAPVDQSFAARWCDESHRQGLLKQWRNSRLAHHLATLDFDALPKAKIPPGADWDAEQQRGTSAAPPTRLTSSPPAQEDVEAGATVGPPPMPAVLCPPDDLADISLPANSLDLIEKYFVHTQTWLPILDKHHVFRAYYRCKSQLALLRSDCSLAPLLAILYYGQLQSQPRAEGDAVLAVEETRQHAALFHAAKRLISIEDDLVTVCKAQTFLILALSYLRRCHTTSANLMLAQASRMAYMLRAADPVQLDGIGIDRLPHILRACFCLDGMVCALTNLPTPFATLAAAGLSDVSVDDLEEWSPAPLAFASALSATPAAVPVQTLSTFNEMGYVVQDVITARRHSSNPTTSAEECADLAYRTKGALDLQHRELSLLREPALPHKLTLVLLRMVTLLSLHTRAPRQFDDFESVIGMLCDLGTLFETKVEMLTRLSILPPWPLLLSIMLEQLSIYQCPTASDGWMDATWAILQRMASALAQLDPSPLLTAVSERFQSRYPQPKAPNVLPQAAAVSDSAPFPPWDTANTGDDSMQDMYVDPRQMPATAGTVSAEAQNFATVSSVPPGGSMDDSGSIAFDFLAIDAMRNETYGQSLLNLGFAADDNLADLDDLFESLGSAPA